MIEDQNYPTFTCGTCSKEVTCIYLNHAKDTYECVRCRDRDERDWRRRLGRYEGYPPDRPGWR